MNASPLADGAEKAAELMRVVDTLGDDAPFFFVETGTNCGHTLSAVSEFAFFDHCFSMENYHPAYLNCIRDLWSRSDITVVYADSGIHLPRLLDEIGRQGCFIWLDAHGAEPDSASPLSDELNHLFGRMDAFDREEDRHVILIDDYRCFAEYDKWPSVEWIEEQAVRRNYSYSVENDIIRLLP